MIRQNSIILNIKDAYIILFLPILKFHFDQSKMFISNLTKQDEIVYMSVLVKDN